MALSLYISCVHTNVHKYVTQVFLALLSPLFGFQGTAFSPVFTLERTRLSLVHGRLGHCFLFVWMIPRQSFHPLQGASGTAFTPYMEAQALLSPPTWRLRHCFNPRQGASGTAFTALKGASVTAFTLTQGGSGIALTHYKKPQALLSPPQ